MARQRQKGTGPAARGISPHVVTLMDWTKEQIADLAKCWAEGLSTGQIGRKLGCSKSAAIGKIHRLHLPGRPSPIRHPSRPPEWAKLSQAGQKAPTSKYNTRPKKITEPKKSFAEPVPTARDHRRAFYAGLGTNGHTCTAPIGERRTPEFKICDAPAVVGRSYCLEHCVEYLIPVRPLLDRSRRPPDPTGVDPT